MGIREESGEAMIGTKDGMMRARTIRRNATHVQIWSRIKLDEVKSTPWDVGRGIHRGEDIDIEVPGQEEEVK